MPTNTESLNRGLFRLLAKYKPKPLDAEGKATPIPDEADIFKFEFTKDGEEYGTVYVTLDEDRVLTVYFGDDVSNSPGDKTPGLDYNDTWSGLLHQLSAWRMTHGLKGFNTQNKDRVGDDMARRNHMRNKDKLAEGYYATGKKSSYSDAVPTVKIVIEHSRVIEEGEQRYRNINRIFLENQLGERYLLDTKKPGIARVYARHIAEGGKVNDDRWSHIGSLCEEYTKMAGFVRATRNGQFNESAQSLVNEGIAHYASLRESLSRMTGKRGYNAYFESWTPSLMEDGTEENNLNELFVQETLDPRIESVMPILNRIHKKVSESAVDKEMNKLAEWADSLVEEESIQSNNPIGIPESLDQHSPVTQAITRRILMQHPDLLQKYGPEKVGDAIDSVAEYVGDVEEIGSSDVSGWVKQVAQSLDGIAEGKGMDPKFDLDDYDNMSDEPEARNLIRGTSRKGHVRMNEKEIINAFGPPGQDGWWVLKWSNGFVATIYPDPGGIEGMDWNIGGTDPNTQHFVELAIQSAADEFGESALQAYLGDKKYGEKGMDALRAAGREHASKTKMQNIRAKFSHKEKGVAEGWPGELAGGTVGGIAGNLVGTAIGGPIGGIVGGAVGGAGGGIIGRELTKEEQLNEFAPLLATGARLVIAMAPKIAQVIKNAGMATAKAAGPVAKSGAEIAAKNAGQIGVGLGAYEIGTSVAEIAKEITSKVGTALEEKTVLDLANVAFKFAIPAGIVLAILYGGKKAIDSLFSDSKPSPGVAEGSLNEFQDTSGKYGGGGGGDGQRQRIAKRLIKYAEKQGLRPGTIEVGYSSETGVYQVTGLAMNHNSEYDWRYKLDPYAKKLVAVDATQTDAEYAPDNFVPVVFDDVSESAGQGIVKEGQDELARILQIMNHRR